MPNDLAPTTRHFQEYAYRAFPRFVKDLEALVNIESESRDAQDSRKVAGWLKRNLTSLYLPTVDALAVEVHNEHDLQKEYADLNTFAPRLVSVLLLIQALNQESQ